MTQEGSQDYYSIIMNNIRSLQKREEKLYSELNKYGLSDQAKNQIIAKINNLSNERIELYNILENNSLFMQNLVKNSEQDLKNKNITIGIIENELSDIKDKYNSIKSGHINKLRMVEINTYYSKKYKAYSELMKSIIIICIPILILSVLSNINILPVNISRSISTFILLVGGLYIMTRVYDLYTRNNMDYDQYDFPFNASERLKEDTGKVKNISQILKHDLKEIIDPLKNKLNIGCIGSECCSNDMIYDNQINRCVDNGNKHYDNKHHGDKKIDPANESIFDRYKADF